MKIGCFIKLFIWNSNNSNSSEELKLLFSRTELWENSSIKSGVNYSKLWLDFLNSCSEYMYVLLGIQSKNKFFWHRINCGYASPPLPVPVKFINSVQEVSLQVSLLFHP